VTPNLKARIPSYLLTLSLSPALHAEHASLHKKSHYTSSAQLTVQHTVEELQDSLLLAVINFPRKQIGPKMSDCLVTGVQPVGPLATQDVKREHTVCIRPFSVSPNPSSLQVEPGSRVGILPTQFANGHLVTSNPRDLTWEEFALLHLAVGRITSYALPPETPGPQRSAEGWVLHSFRVDFGDETGGERDAAVWLVDDETPLVDLAGLVGRQVLAVVNIALEPETAQDSPSAPFLTRGAAAILTVGGRALLEPRKEVPNGNRLA